MIIELIGPLGSGKGTQARFLVEKYGFFYLESGQILRELAKGDKELSDLINTKGKLISDERSTEIFENYLLKNKPDLENILLDGFPRTVGQYKMFAEWLKTKNKRIDKVVLLDIDEETSIKRTEARRYCQNCGEIYNLITDKTKVISICDKCGGKLSQREDDKPDAIKRRLLWYRETTLPLVTEFEKQGILFKVNGEAVPQQIFKEIVDKLNL